MPIFDFECNACDAGFEELVRADERVACPECASTDVKRLLSQVSPPGKFEVRGAAARRSNSVRTEREAVKREQFSAERKRARG